MKLRYLSRIILFIALSMMIGSALISYTFIMQTEPQIVDLKASVENKQTLIRDVWATVARKEGRADMAVLLSLLAENKVADVTALKKHYLGYFPDLNERSNPSDITSGVEREIEKTSEYINKLYFEQIQIQNNLAQMELQAKFYADLAFFMQILSLILILLRKDFLV